MRAKIPFPESPRVLTGKQAVAAGYVKILYLFSFQLRIVCFYIITFTNAKDGAGSHKDTHVIKQQELSRRE